MDEEKIETEADVGCGGECSDWGVCKCEQLNEGDCLAWHEWSDAPWWRRELGY